MKEPSTPDELLELHKILRSDPQRYLQIVDEWIRDNPNNGDAYYDRHQAWMRIGEPWKALEDLNKAIALREDPAAFAARGSVYRHLGDYHRALDDYRRGEAIHPAQWLEDAFGLLLQADTHARLGDDSAAQACCARLPEDFWTPGLNDAPAGDKAAIAERLKFTAAEARRARN
jgi:tetratricopeptide (TPR) repeat protein